MKIVELSVELCVAWRNYIIHGVTPRVETEAARITLKITCREFLCGSYRGRVFMQYNPKVEAMLSQIIQFLKYSGICRGIASLKVQIPRVMILKASRSSYPV